MRITVDIAGDPDIVSPVVASSVIRDGVCYITVNPSIAPAQLPFVVAHELGHLFTSLIYRHKIALHPSSNLDTVLRIVGDLVYGSPSALRGLDVTPPKPFPADRIGIEPQIKEAAFEKWLATNPEKDFNHHVDETDVRKIFLAGWNADLPGYHEAKMVECDAEGRLADGSYHWQKANEARATRSWPSGRSPSQASEAEEMSADDKLVYLTEALHRIENESHGETDDGSTRDDLRARLGIINLLAEQGLAYTMKGGK